eukprot:COSAG01_NODE_8692_length_2695_cov_4.327427_2_plen_504_part_00
MVAKAYSNPVAAVDDVTTPAADGNNVSGGYGGGGGVGGLRRSSSRIVPPSLLNPVNPPESPTIDRNMHDKARSSLRHHVRQLDVLSRKVPSFLTGIDSETDELQQMRGALLQHLADIREEIEAIQESQGMDKAWEPTKRKSTDDGSTDDGSSWWYFGALVTITHFVVFCAALVSATVRTIAGDILVSRQQQPWHESAALPVVAFSAPPVNHSFVIERCTILDGDYMGRNCIDISSLVDYSCPELAKAKGYSHYLSDGAFCINTEGYTQDGAQQPVVVESTFGHKRYEYLRVDLMRDGGEAKSGFMNIFILDHTLSLFEEDWTNFAFNYNPILWSGVEMFFKQVHETIHDKLWNSESRSYLMYDHQYSRLDSQTSWASEATNTRASVLTFYLRSALLTEKTIVRPELRVAGLFAQVGGIWVAWDWIFVLIAAIPAILAQIHRLTKKKRAKQLLIQSYVSGAESEAEKNQAEKDFNADLNTWLMLHGNYKEIPTTKEDLQAKIME